MTSLKYKQYIYDVDTLTWKRAKRYFLPLGIVRLGLLLLPEQLLQSLLRKILDDSRGEMQGITLKQSIRVIYTILNEIALAKDSKQNQIVFEDKEKQRKHVILVE